MSQGLVERQNLEDIADAIRSKNGSTDTYTPAEMAQAISGIHTADEVVLVQKTVNANGQYNASDDSADGYSGVRVNVPNTYSASDEGKVVSNGGLVAQTTKQITANGTHDTTTNNSVAVDVPNSYAASDNGKVVVNQELVAQTSKNINANGTHDTTANNSVVVNVPNTYVSSDNGKVVANQELIAQTSKNITSNGTHDTTINNSVVVNVPNTYESSDEGKVVSGGELINQTSREITQNGSYNTTANNRIIINVSGGGDSNVVAFIKITYDIGAICSITDGTNTFDAPDTSGEWIAEIPDVGIWTITATEGSRIVTKTVNIQYADSIVKNAEYHVGSDYQEVEYLQTGTAQGAYIDTGLQWSSQRYFEVTYQFLQTVSGEQWWFGFYGNSYTEIMCNDAYTTIYINEASYQRSSASAKHIIKVDSSGCYFDDSLITNRNLGNPSNCDVLLFARSNGTSGAAMTSAAGIRIYHCKFYDGDNIVRDLYPCYRKSDNVPGMYDRINETFYPNKGTQSFIVGQDV
jgi:hypothetical protein